MVLSDEADSGNAFDAVYSTAHADKDTKDHFVSPGSMLNGGTYKRAVSEVTPWRELVAFHSNCNSPAAEHSDRSTIAMRLIGSHRRMLSTLVSANTLIGRQL